MTRSQRRPEVAQITRYSFMEIIGRAHRLHRALTCRGKWGKVSHLFSWLSGGETMKIELFVNIDCESLIFCEQIRGKIKNNFFTKQLKMMFSKKLRFDQLTPWVG